ncbi:MFS transporter [Cryobacterium luteum]|uniref:MFS transporter n=1 Tax=Cryobacterium luteum TaxID=1424661 RepID=A0A1H8E803_9MICO|nr:MFS transporter [Cryobacterium luteum]TFB89839.1 MFS transporter [Cryobacterium luteum]SEN15592.1 Major Facilitator Superfamily protein [Cryobacterium luteum]
MSNTQRPLNLRSIALTAFLPTLLFSVGEGAIIPLIPLVANDLGATLAVAGVIAAMIMFGELVGDIPSGWIVARIGERNSMIYASLVTIGAVIICIVAPSPLVLGLGIFLIGIATAVFALARHAFMTSYVPLVYRARALSTLGGVFRAGWFVGPFLSAALIHLTGSTQAAFWVFIVCCVLAVATLVILPDPTRGLATPGAGPARAGSEQAGSGRSGPSRAGSEQAGSERSGSEQAGSENAASALPDVATSGTAAGLFQTIRAHRGVLVRLGTGAALVGAMRASRTVMLPLWAVSIGVSAPDTALIIGIAGGIDFLLFYVSGQIMDRFGRIWSAVPSMIGLGLGHVALAFTHDLPSTVGWFIGVAMFLALANGIGSGLLMTLGADLAPQRHPAPFLGAWRFTADFGSAAAPLAVAGITALASLSIASGIIGVFGLFGAVLLGRYIPRFAPHRPRSLL